MFTSLPKYFYQHQYLEELLDSFYLPTLVDAIVGIKLGVQDEDGRRKICLKEKEEMSPNWKVLKWLWKHSIILYESSGF
jgi:hypothetical protein